MKTILVVLFVYLICGDFSYAQQEYWPNKSIRKERSNISDYQPERYQILNINNITTWAREDGHSNHTPTIGNNGVIFPRGTTNIIYQDGLLWGASAYIDRDHTIPAPFNQTIRVGGSTYRPSTKAGWVEGIGSVAVAVDPDHPRARIYRIRRDWQEMSEYDLRRDATESFEIPNEEITEFHMQQIKDQYEKDWHEWPVDLGAPFIDRNGNGVFNPPPLDFKVRDLIDKNYDEPGIAANANMPADQVIWTVYNDLDREQSVGRFGSEPIGLEIQLTIWGYNRSDALGNVYFRRWKIINKGGVDINENGEKGTFFLDSMYVGQWSDPDLGDFGDDLVGCDTVLNLGYIYNGKDSDRRYSEYSLPPPSGGYDLIQGPIVKSLGSQAIYDFQRKYNSRNLKMASFSFITFFSPSYYHSGYQLSIVYYKMLRGYAPLSGPDVYYSHPPGIIPGHFPLSGDPVAGTGHIDGQGQYYSFVPGDRRFIMSTGPFQMAPGDTQEVVIAFIAGLGSDRLSSISVMKYNSRVVQSIYDGLFQVASPPNAPSVKVAELDRKVILEWGSNLDRVAETEDRISEPGAYVFEGYNIYQFSNANDNPKEDKRIVTVDLPTDPTVILDDRFDAISRNVLRVPVQFGSNNGIRRYFVFERDYLREIDQLNNGQEYYLAVTAYSRSTVAGFVPGTIESMPKILTAIPQSRKIGQSINTDFGEEIDVEHTSGSGDALVEALVINPQAIVPSTYTISWHEDRTWQLLKNSTIIVSGQTNTSLDEDYPIVDGFQVKVGGELSFEFPVTASNVSQTVDANSKDGDLHLYTGTDIAGVPFPQLYNLWINSSYPPLEIVQRDLEYRFTGLTKSNDDNNDAPIVTGGQWSTQWQYKTLGDLDLSGFNHVQVRLPFELWDVEENRQVNVVVFNRNADKASPYGFGIGDPHIPGIEPRYRMAGRDYIIPIMSDYLGDEIAKTMTFTPLDSNATWFMFFEQKGESVWSHGDVYLVEFPNPIVPGLDEFTFSTKGLETTYSAILAKNELDRIGIYPNPYYALNPQEIDRAAKFVTFHHLPEHAIIRIFNLAGQFIRRIDHYGDQFGRWDLRNQNNYLVASGMYIIHIEIPGLGNRILKLAVIQEDKGSL